MTVDPEVEALARRDVNAVLATQYDGEPVVLVDAVPGAGKTWLVEHLAVQAAACFGERCMIVTQTNAQAFDLAERFGERWSRHPVTLFVTKELAVPDEVRQHANVHVARQTDELLPAGPAIVIANADRWSWSSLAGGGPAFDVQVVDEAYQLPDHTWLQVAGLAERWVLVGDPGQIDPVIDVDTARWADDPAGPHVAAPRALVARKNGVVRLALRVTHRLTPETTSFVGPAFYPELTMRAAVPQGRRGLQTTVGGVTGADRVIGLAQREGGIVMGELPPRRTGRVDAELVATVVGIAERLVARGTIIRDEWGERLLRPERMGVICAHVEQVSAIQSALPPALRTIRVETANRWQGLQVDVSIVAHPLSGRADVEAFHLDAGRLCVMLSRHRVVCLVVARGGLGELLERHIPLDDRVPGIDMVPGYVGWRAHRELLRRLDVEGRILSLP